MDKRWKRHSAEDIVAKLDHVRHLVAGGMPVTSATASIGVSDATYFRWRKQYSGLRVTQLAYIKELEAEVARLRRAISECDDIRAS